MVTMLELSCTYRFNAQAIRMRISELRAEKKIQTDAEAIRQLDHRISELEPLLREARELAVLTAHYYDRGYHKNEKYTL